ncbi:hypothetical protein QDG88_19210 [Pseudoalteromonas piscicida]|uniref:hypothetical protein n=1 Tax=Pseudoalteromonas piscicida TaxID=43662 RepID=UPI00273A1586|nr:hypothetical protein [Pseudoalteromonas piscicida]MDP4490044.1 hypothetical protein [Pseudoalteromonas piscicida]
MDKFKVVYVDEDESDRTEFRVHFIGKEQCELILLHPEENIDHMTQIIIDINPDAVVSDFQLKIKEPKVQYNGADLISKLKREKEYLPCFLLTSYEGEAVNHAVDVNWVHDKDELIPDGSEKPAFSVKVVQQIHVNKTIVDNLKSERSELMGKASLNELEKRKLIDINNEIERYLFKDEILPKELKELDGLHKLDKLIELSELLINSIESNKS